MEATMQSGLMVGVEDQGDRHQGRTRTGLHRAPLRRDRPRVRGPAHGLRGRATSRTSSARSSSPGRTSTTSCSWRSGPRRPSASWTASSAVHLGGLVVWGAVAGSCRRVLLAARRRGEAAASSSARRRLAPAVWPSSTPPSPRPSSPARSSWPLRDWGLGQARWLAVKLGLTAVPARAPRRRCTPGSATAGSRAACAQTAPPPLLARTSSAASAWTTCCAPWPRPCWGWRCRCSSGSRCGGRSRRGCAERPPAAAGRPGSSSQSTRAVTCMSTKSVTTAPTVTVSPVYPSKKNA